MCQTPSKVNSFMTLGPLLPSYYVAKNMRAIGRINTAITGYLLIMGLDIWNDIRSAYFFKNQVTRKYSKFVSFVFVISGYDIQY